jgi:hypothetical protein
MPISIDLARFNSPGIRVYAGRPRGEAARSEAGLDEADTKGEMVEVRVPPDLFSINSSFFLGMFGDSIRNLGEEEFRRRYTFVGPDIRMVIEDSIREAVNTGSPFAPRDPGTRS